MIIIMLIIFTIIIMIMIFTIMIFMIIKIIAFIIFINMVSAQGQGCYPKKISSDCSSYLTSFYVNVLVLRIEVVP